MNAELPLGREFFFRPIRLLIILSYISVSGCSSIGDCSGFLDKTLNSIGLQRSPTQTSLLDGVAHAELKMPSPPNRKIILRMHAGSTLNTDANGRSLSVITKIYKLRNRESFENAPYRDFLAPDKSSSFASDIVEVHEVVLTPGKAYEVIESVNQSAPYFAVVALFRNPAENRWRFVFETNSASKSGITLGFHACALSISTGQALGASSELLRVAGVRCSVS